MRAVKLKYSAPIGLIIWAVCLTVLCTKTTCSITIAKLPGIFAVGAGFIAASIAVLSLLPQVHKLLRLPTLLLAIVYFAAMNYLTVKTYTVSPLFPAVFYPNWLFWSVLGVVYAVCIDKISSSEANLVYKTTHALLCVLLVFATLYIFTVWLLDAYVQRQLLAFIFTLGGWRFVVWLKDNFAEDKGTDLF